MAPNSLDAPTKITSAKTCVADGYSKNILEELHVCIYGVIAISSGERGDAAQVEKVDHISHGYMLGC